MVTQYLVEEAVFERLDLMERLTRVHAGSAEMEAAELSPHEAAGQAHAAAMRDLGVM